MSTIIARDGTQIYDRSAQLKVYKGLPHRIAATHQDVTNANLLSFLET